MAFCHWPRYVLLQVLQWVTFLLYLVTQDSSALAAFWSRPHFPCFHIPLAKDSLYLLYLVMYWKYSSNFSVEPILCRSVTKFVPGDNLGNCLNFSTSLLTRSSLKTVPELCCKRCALLGIKELIWYPTLTGWFMNIEIKKSVVYLTFWGGGNAGILDTNYTAYLDLVRPGACIKEALFQASWRRIQLHTCTRWCTGVLVHGAWSGGCTVPYCKLEFSSYIAAGCLLVTGMWLASDHCTEMYLLSNGSKFVNL